MKMILSLRFLIPLLILLAIGYFLWYGLSINPRQLPSALLGKAAPDFNLPRLRQPHSQLTNRLFHHQVSLLVVWATWCNSCAREHPVLMDISRTHIVPIYGLDYKDNRQQAIDYLTTYGNPYKAVGFDQFGKIAINWGVYGTPETFVMDKQGIIRYKQIGPINHQIWQTKLLPLIKKLKQ